MRPIGVWMALAELALVALLSGCATRSANTISEGYAGASGIRSFLLCAPNTFLALPGELQDGTTPLREEIQAYLREHGREVQWIDLYTAKQLWLSAVTRAKEEGESGNALAHFAGELARRYEFQAIVVPSLLLHEARASLGRVSWDGVKRRMRKVNAPRREGIGRHQDVVVDGARFEGVSGSVSVTSVHVVVFTRDGARVFEGRGGLELVQEVDLSNVSTQNEVELRQRGDLFQEREVLREAVEIAFDPLLTPPEEP